jgi:hypothetical protein
VSVHVERNFPALDELLLTTADDMREIGLLARERIYRRTISGVDAQGNAFAPYSPEYAKAKGSATGSSVVNLQLSGNMLNHMGVIEVTDDSVTLGWNQ